MQARFVTGAIDRKFKSFVAEAAVTAKYVRQGPWLILSKMPIFVRAVAFTDIQ